MTLSSVNNIKSWILSVNIDVHFGVCIKVKKDLGIKMYGFQLSKGWCVFFYFFGTVLQSLVYF